MSVKGFACVAAFFIMAGVTLAEEVAPKPANSVQQVCDEAMPDLLQGKEKGFETLKKAAADPRMNMPLDNEAYKFRRDYADYREKLGEPIAWKYLGVKKVGTVIREYVYVCQNSKMPLFWYFGAYELDGQWHLTSFKWDNQIQRLLDTIPADGSSKDPACAKLCEEILDPLIHGKGEAADAFIRHLVDQSPATVAFFDRAIKELSSDSSKNGRVVKCELVHAKEIGGLAGECFYAVQWERGLRLFRFYLYRSEKDWKVEGFWADRDPKEVLQRVGMELNPLSTAPQTAQSNDRQTK